ncbi:MAG: NADH-quinone oxidoreductase subunit NuoE [Ignavibacteria bacterium]|jgi:NADH-quinone oxidoreductase E subunit|nr:NADH-quinone oxidoreductase subunit NuoE [Ignavibacteria bacterium]
MEISFSKDDLVLIDNIQAKYPVKDASIMPVLWLAQKKFGWISPDVILLVAQLLSVSPSKVEGVATFYTMFYKKPMGKYHIQVCTNISCMLRDGVKIYDYLSDKFNIKNMETTADGMYSLEEVECMGACGGAPMIAINEDYYENITIEKLDSILNTLK